jgi:hypothetical protein
MDSIFPVHDWKPETSRIYFDFSDFVYVPQQYEEHKGNPRRSIVNPWLISLGRARKVMNVIYESPRSFDPFYELLLWFSSAEKALLVLEGEGMLQGSAELSEFTLTADPFPLARNADFAASLH